MHLTSLFTVEQLAAALLRQHGKDALVKVVGEQNDSKETIYKIVVVKEGFTAKEVLTRLAGAVSEALACDDPSALGNIVAGPMDDARHLLQS